MKIAEFAKACGAAESKIRFYDRNNLLKPAQTNALTGYRYYDESQVALFRKINTLQSAGFTHSEIRKIIDEKADPKSIKDIISEKEKQLGESLRMLRRIYKSVEGGDFMNNIPIAALHENIDLPFENDEAVIGRWEITGDNSPDMGSRKREVYFLPKGERYWNYGWTKGKFLYEDGVSSCVCDYVLESADCGLNMTIYFRTYDGTIDPIRLKKLDGIHRTSEEIARKDNIDIPFENDPDVLGKWKAADFIKSKTDFSADCGGQENSLYFSEIEFLPEGECVSVYGGETISGSSSQTWTKGFVLRKWNSTACGYEIKSSGGRKFLIMEWKSGDYRWGGYDTDYYVFEKTE